jgi:hypothetical protein
MKLVLYAGYDTSGWLQIIWNNERIEYGEMPGIDRWR